MHIYGIHIYKRIQHNTSLCPTPLPRPKYTHRNSTQWLSWRRSTRSSPAHTEAAAQSSVKCTFSLLFLRADCRSRAGGRREGADRAGQRGEGPDDSWESVRSSASLEEGLWSCPSHWFERVRQCPRYLPQRPFLRNHCVAPFEKISFNTYFFGEGNESIIFQSLNIWGWGWGWGWLSINNTNNHMNIEKRRRRIITPFILNYYEEGQSKHDYLNDTISMIDLEVIYTKYPHRQHWSRKRGGATTTTLST